MPFTVVSLPNQTAPSTGGFKVGALPTTTSHPDTLASLTPAQQINQNYQSGKISAPDTVIQDVGEAARQTNDALTSPYSPIGWVTDAIGGASKLLAAPIDAIDSIIAPKIGSALRNAVGAGTADKIGQAVLGNKVVQGANNLLTSPSVSGDLGAVGNVANLAATVVGSGEAAKALPEGVAGVKGKVVAPPPTPEGLAAKITQASPAEIPIAQRALASIDTSNVKTFSDLSTQLDSQIKANTKSVDAIHDTSPQVYRPQAIDQTTPVKGGNPIVSNPVSDALDQLQKFYEKTNDTQNTARIQGLKNEYQTDGLNVKQINAIAREHGAELNGYNANGELASGLSKQAAENTRQAVKGVVRSLDENQSTAIDKNTHDLISTKALVDEMTNKVQMLENKLKTYSPLQQVGRYAGKAVDMFSGGMVKGFLRSVMGIGGESGTSMNALDLQKSLQGNLKLLDKLNSMPTHEAVAEIGKIVNPPRSTPPQQLQ